ncbi:Zn-dependent peptidase ImmA (M78 family) [Clostridium acetobutylicum]|uniref:Predicted metal-dependent hydrolase n=1 Tax=Clostridium acetobutylicum (strain ATCC 824 / DSM 792 / JCM 1419 / IAM 19013 / LMG 5710 / NBRC 13948 / NRRL B-527 / VKM B-1787 / 2291 / W) TaxID=272562 RepID=Q97LL0_CLOAB|nr:MULTISPECIES: ImmA/IrrE family metallo-endopeptidase [Clostridium]AAK78527.1 Predicted metal-dependent hydrolase [Clostridium acetobutylicum ATCC 824]ADZ19600.1 metal-dependent hydrolase [Clostridium acetobutylicum EA 2018]AEI31301.1 metal-dependent hydrolase [Clostridium acetobutylicum DSM 1731]AWV80249.1 ImmA/IrrE family metallo-endopeptidase [Clostridium acetobutylicum]MBC2392434.1 ImmA/IrrE family metallo-endopeptidase [Clostridium acetobutylicum]
MEWIDNIILGLVSNFKTRDVHELCDCLNIKVIKLPFNNILLRKKDALYYRDYQNNEIIFIKDNLPLSLEKFILSHELGHALCNPDLLCAAFTFSNKGKFERQANYFAFKLINIKFDEIELEGMSLEQIAALTQIPYNVLSQFIM